MMDNTTAIGYIKFYKQSRSANIINPVKPSLRPLAMVSRTLYNNHSAPFAEAVKPSDRF